MGVLNALQEAERKIKEANRSSENIGQLIRQFKTVEQSLSHSVCDKRSEMRDISHTLSLLFHAACAHTSPCT